ncbi:peptidoglycan DL-endopeptidase CwlO-like [Ptychodera flava]|uniref:peptidoglycan DL-endopeptidase CwlO-like n=1 Tax=Ptychodera flava TaxID=63121 RepID=UPI003969DC82
MSSQTKLSDVKSELTDARNELWITEGKVTKAKKQLESTKDELAKAKSELAQTKRQVHSGELQTTATKEDNTVEQACAQSSKITKPQTAVKAKEYVATALEASDVKDKDANIEASKDHATTTCPSARFPVQVTETNKASESRDSNENTIKPANALDSNGLGKTKHKPGNAQTKVKTVSIKSDAEGEASEYVATALEAGDAKDEAVKVEAAKDDVTTTCKSARFPSQATENCKDSESRDPNSNTINTMTVQHLVGHR